MKSFRFVCAAVTFSILSMPATAAIIGGSVIGGGALIAGGTFIKLTPPIANPIGMPNSVGDDTFQTMNLYGFDEDQNITLSAPLAVDIGLTPTLLVGTVVASHYLFFDPGPMTSLVGTVDFNSPVLAIITSTDSLFASDFLARTGINYLNPDARGLEAGQDTVSMSGERQIRFDVLAATPGDYVRVLTTFSPEEVASPEPGAALLLVSGVGLIAGYRYQRGRVAASRKRA